MFQEIGLDCSVQTAEMDKQTFFSSPQIRKFLGSFRYSKLAIYLDFSVNRKYQNNPKRSFSKVFFYFVKL
jgi:hypothetical protein